MEARTVETSDGGSIAFEKLLIATGGTPIVPQDVEGTDAEVEDILCEYSRALNLEGLEFERDDFVRLIPKTTRPYGRLYAY